MATAALHGEGRGCACPPARCSLIGKAQACETSHMRLHLVDGTFELFRAHYSKRAAHPLKARRGVMQSLLALIANPAEQVTHIAVAFDNPIRSFRNDLFPAYKSDEGGEPALRAQFDTVDEAG